MKLLCESLFVFSLCDAGVSAGPIIRKACILCVYARVRVCACVCVVLRLSDALEKGGVSVRCYVTSVDAAEAINPDHPQLRTASAGTDRCWAFPLKRLRVRVSVCVCVCVSVSVSVSV